MIFHPSYLLLIPGMILMFWAQNRVQSTYHKYSQVRSTMGMTGAQVAQEILNRMGVHNVQIEPIAGNLPTTTTPALRKFAYLKAYMVLTL